MRAIGPRERIIRALFYKEWLAHRNLIVEPWALWLVCGLVLPVFHHPGWILVLGLIYGFLAGSWIGGMDAGQGTEEFTFALPATRRQIYLTRLALFGGNLIALLAAGLLTIAFNVPQHLWGLVVESGPFTEPFPVARGLWYAIAFCAPLAAGACVFMAAADAGSRSEVANAGPHGIGLAGFVGIWGWLAEDICWNRVDGLIVCPALLILTVSILRLGLYRFMRKEGGICPSSVRGGRWKTWLLLGILVAGLLSFLCLTFA